MRGLKNASKIKMRGFKIMRGLKNVKSRSLMSDNEGP